MTSNNPLEDWFSFLKSWAVQNANQYLYVPIPKARTEQNYTEHALVAERSYFRLWLSEMFLTKSRTWFKDWHPAVHSSVHLKFGHSNTVRFSHVARAPEEAISNGVHLNYALTELLPFKGGVIEIEAALLALQGANYLEASIGLLQSFSSLVSAPLGQALNIADKVASGIQNLFGATNGKVHLSLHQTFVGEGGAGNNALQPGYIAVLLATEKQVNKERLYVKNDRLYYSAEAEREPVPLQGYDYLLLRVEGQEERDDWSTLKDIQQPLNDATEALIQGENEKADAFKKATLVAVMRSPDLTNLDRRRVALAIKDELNQIQDMGLGAIGDEARNLNHIMATHAISRDQAAALGNISLEELIE